MTFTGPNVQTVFTNSFDTNVTGTVNAVDYLAPPLVSDTGAVAFSQAGAAGLSPEITRRATRKVSVPMRSGAESLNVGVAAGILLYQLRHDR